MKTNSARDVRARPRTPFYQWTSVLVVAAALVGLGVGIAWAGGSDVRTTSEYKVLTSTLESTQGELQDTIGTLSAAQSELVDTKSKLESVASGLPAREKAVKKAGTRLRTGEAALAKAQKAVTEREKAVDEREDAVKVVETGIADNTIPGDGIYEVGIDMKAGTYKSVDNSECYYAVLADANGRDVLSNKIISGRAVVSVSKGTFFETTGCGDWTLQP